MTYQIDQSGKIEQTERHTAIACTNGNTITIVLKKTEKRKLQSLFRTVGLSKLFPYLTFAALVALLIKKLEPKHRLTIDREYVGHEDLIEEKIKIYLKELGTKSNHHLEFGHVGKLSSAHTLAYETARGRKKPNLVVDAKEIMKLIIGTKKIGVA